MLPNTLTNNPAVWTNWQKILFRFFFVFLLIQTLTEVFWGNLFGGSLVIWRLGETIFVPPCLWLNKNIFHFIYKPQTWTTFSGSLHTIRDIVYLVVACVSCVLWTIADRRRTNYNTLYYWLSQWLIMLLSCIAFAYGTIKLIPVQMNTPSVINLYKPVGNLSPFELVWITFGYGKPYQVFAGLFEVMGAVLILFKRTRMAGLLILVSVMLNVIFLNYTYQIGVLILSFYIFLICLFLLSAYARQLVAFFFTRQPVIWPKNEYVPPKNLTLRLLKLAAMLFMGFSFISDLQFAYSTYTKRVRTNQSGTYSLVKNYMVNNDTMPSIENDTTRWRLWSESVRDGKRLVTITTMKPGVYTIYAVERDSVHHQIILHPSNKKDTTPLLFSYADMNNNIWCMQGMIHQKKMTVELQKINPDTMLTLLKTRRTIITFDDDSDHE